MGVFIKKKFKKEKRKKKKNSPKPILLATVSYEGGYSNLCIMDWNSKVNLECVLSWHLFTRETQPIFDDRWTVFRWFNERKSTKKETRETFP